MEQAGTVKCEQLPEISKMSSAEKMDAFKRKSMADGQWTEDPRNAQTCRNRFGTYNSVLNLAQK